MKSFNVYLHGREIDTVFYNDDVSITTEEVKRSLINHDGYDYKIKVCKVRQSFNRGLTK